MVTKEKIERYIEKVPPIPKELQRCIESVEKGDLTKAAKIASENRAICTYLIETVNRPIFGFFRNRVENISQIFGILGLTTAKQLLYAYLNTLLLPSKWRVFELDNTSFFKLQSDLLFYWNKILEFEKNEEDHLKIAINFIPSAIFVAEEMFKENFEEFVIIKQVKEINYNEMLQKFTGMNLFDISSLICKKWNMPQPIIQLLKDLGELDASDEKYGKFVRYMHLLLFFEFSKPLYIQAGLNDFIEFHPDFVEEVYQNFNQIVGLYETCN